VSLDLGKTVLQLDRASHNLASTYNDRRVRLETLLETAVSIRPDTAIEKTRSATNRPYMSAQVGDSLLGTHAPDPPPPDWCAVSVDGSHIDVDRHLPVQCYLVNLGGCVLTYGTRPDASFFNQPRLGSDPSELYLTEPANPNAEEAITGPLLGLLRTVWELERLVAVVQECPPDVPTLALIDGTLVLWGLSGQGYRPFVRKAVLHDRFLPALDRLRELAQSRPLTLAAYVSLPRTTEVANAIRCCLCPYDINQCVQSCSNRRAILSPCDATNGFLDRELFQDLLEPGWRSAVYRTNPVAAQEYYGEQQVHFYYLHSGEEIARVEVPQWVARDEKLLSLGHSLIVEQCRRGQGYPVAISEAHEQAVITGQDRQLFKQMVEETLQSRGLPTFTSEKERSKQRPWV
jgi:GNAT superfamily N-acetyltransferase